MKIRLISTLVIILLINNLYSQLNQTSKKELKIIIKEGFNNSTFNSFTWNTCNEDSLYFFADTIKFYDGNNYFNQIEHCCQFVEWQIFKGKSIRRQESQICNEPPSVSVATYYSFKYKVIVKNKRVLIQTTRSGNQKEYFVLIKIENVVLPSGRLDGHRIVLKRMKE